MQAGQVSCPGVTELVSGGVKWQNQAGRLSLEPMAAHHPGLLDHYQMKSVRVLTLFQLSKLEITESSN